MQYSLKKLFLLTFYVAMGLTIGSLMVMCSQLIHAREHLSEEIHASVSRGVRIGAAWGAGIGYVVGELHLARRRKAAAK